MARLLDSKNHKGSKLAEHVNNNVIYEFIDGNINCRVCRCILNVAGSGRIQIIHRHETSKKHINNDNYVLTNQKEFLSQTENKIDSECLNATNVHQKLVEAMIACNVPINVADNPQFKDFFKGCFNFELFSGETYRTTFFDKVRKKKK